MTTWLDQFTSINGRADAEAASFGEDRDLPSYEATRPITAFEWTCRDALLTFARNDLPISLTETFTAAISAFFLNPSTVRAVRADCGVWESVGQLASEISPAAAEHRPATFYIDFSGIDPLMIEGLKISAVFIATRLLLSEVGEESDLLLEPARWFAVIGPEEFFGTHVLSWSEGQPVTTTLECISLPRIGEPQVDTAPLRDFLAEVGRDVAFTIECISGKIRRFADERRPDRGWPAVPQVSSRTFDVAAMRGETVHDASIFHIARLEA